MRNSPPKLEPNQSRGNNVSSLYLHLHRVRTKENSHYQSASRAPRSCIIQIIPKEEQTSCHPILEVFLNSKILFFFQFCWDRQKKFFFFGGGGFGFLPSLLKYYSNCRGIWTVHSLRSTSGATHANLLVAGGEASHFPKRHMHQKRWDWDDNILVLIRMGNHPDRRFTHYHCASDSAVIHTNFMRHYHWKGIY